MTQQRVNGSSNSLQKTPILMAVLSPIEEIRNGTISLPEGPYIPEDEATTKRNGSKFSTLATNTVLITALGSSVFVALPTTLSPIELNPSTTIVGRSYSADGVVVLGHLGQLYLDIARMPHIQGFREAVYRQANELASIVADFDEIRPGFQITSAPSMIFSIGKKQDRSAIAEFFYDVNTNDFEREVSLVTRTRDRFHAESVDSDLLTDTIRAHLLA